MGAPKDHLDHIPTPEPDDIKRLNDVWSGIAGKDPTFMFSPANLMELWAVEHRVRSERMASERLTLATWVLSGATVVLALSTIALVVVTLTV
jgi:hypothetical protein